MTLQDKDLTCVKTEPEALEISTLFNAKYKGGRIYNALNNSGITTVSQLIKKTPVDLLKLRNFGSGCLYEVCKVLETYGLTLSAETYSQLTSFPLMRYGMQKWALENPEKALALKERQRKQKKKLQKESIANLKKSKFKTPAKAIRAFCHACPNGSSRCGPNYLKAPVSCKKEDCPLYAFRNGIPMLISRGIKQNHLKAFYQSKQEH